MALKCEAKLSIVKAISLMPKLLAVLEKVKGILLPLLPVIILGGVIISLSLGKIPLEQQLGLGGDKATKAQPGQELKRLLAITNLEEAVIATPSLSASLVPASCDCDGQPVGSRRCEANNQASQECREFFDSFCQWQSVEICQYGCQAGQCQPAAISCCTPLESCGGTDYGWGQEGCSFYQRACSRCGQTPPAITPTPTPTTAFAALTPTPTGPVLITPTPTLPPTLACLSVGVYANPGDTTVLNPSLLKVGDRVYLGVNANNLGNPTQARVKINGGVNTAGTWCLGTNLAISNEWCVTTNRVANRFYLPFTLPGRGLFKVETMVYYQLDGQWH